MGNPYFGPADVRWRWGFAIGLVPSLLTIWIYTALKEPEAWIQARVLAGKDRSQQAGRLLDLFARDLIRPTLVGLTLATVGMATFWGVYVRGQSLVREMAEDSQLGESASRLSPKEREVALQGLSDQTKSDLKRTEMLAMLLITTGGGVGLVGFAPLSNRTGRRGAFLIYCLGGLLISVLFFKVLPLGPAWLLWLTLPVFGLFTTGMHAGYAVYFPELFPTRLRGTGGGFCFNGGRLLASVILVVIAAMRTWGFSLANTSAILGLLFCLGVIVLLFAPETKGRELPT